MRLRNFVLILILWLLPVSYFSMFGYGSDEDAWMIGAEGLQIWKTGVYTISRSTGFPLHELICAPLSAVGSWYTCNAFSMLCGILSLVFLRKQHEVRNFRFPWWVLAAIAFLPQVLINASSTLDYLPSMACWMVMYYFFLKRNYYACAIIAGIACGFRPSNGAFILPVCVALFSQKEFYLSLRVFFVAFCVGLFAYSPVLFNYGLLDPTREVSIPWKQNLMIGGYQFLILFGVWQTLVLGIFAVIYGNRILSLLKNNAVVLFHVSSIIFWLLFFFGITSSESEYLFPILPSVIYLLDEVLASSQFKWVVACLLSYNVISLELLGGESGSRKVEPRIEAGITWRDYQDRRFKLWFRKAATDFRCEEKTLLMFGSAYVLANNPAWEYAQGYTNIIKQKQGNFFVSERILDAKQLKELQAQGVKMYVWNKRKWEYLRLDVPEWEKYVQVVEDLDVFLRSSHEGELMQ